jgi:hypothetical protein
MHRRGNHYQRSLDATDINKPGPVVLLPWPVNVSKAVVSSNSRVYGTRVKIIMLMQVVQNRSEQCCAAPREQYC